MLNFERGILKRGDFTYDAVTQIGNKLVIDVEERYGIYYTDIRRKRITRVIKRDGTISLDGAKVSVKDLNGIKIPE